jgi:FMN phosphatase YigB (HAD superfamily)/glycosyltransferase involved in cell wall biosynthesis
MTVAIIHYHLGPGGVSKVIAAASRVLTTSGIRHVILVGSVPGDVAPDLPVRVVLGLGYGRDVSPKRPAGEMPMNENEVPSIDSPPAERLGNASLPEELRSAALDALGQAPDIWHFHNHSLGKNPLIADVVARFAEENERLVLQIHDLAEDGRPENYRMIAECRNLYPVSPRVRYAFLNARDMGIFTGVGLPEEQARVLVNPISLTSKSPIPNPQSPILFAPVRGIRRKNLGEIVFLSALAPEGARFAVSRAPLNPAALPVHDTWRRFARKHQLPIEFDVVDRFAPAAGASPDFESWVAHSTHFVSTSVAEGFGLTFLEAIAHGKPLVGRNLTHITAEHARHGIRAGNLYDRILVPAEWVDLVVLREHLTTTLGRNYRVYGRQLTNEIITATFETLVHDGWLDFGNLTEPLQQGVIERLAVPACRGVPLVKAGGLTKSAEDWLAAAVSNRTPTATPDQLAPYSPAEYGKQITALYADLAGRPSAPVRFLPASEILTAHLAPRSFHFLLSALKPDDAPFKQHRAVVFDIYGTLLIAAPGGVKPDPAADPVLREILERHGHVPPDSPSTALHAAVIRHHAAAAVPFPEIDLRILWREVLSLDPDADLGPLVEELEAAWHPVRPMPGAEKTIQQLARSGVSLGLLSNAQFNTLRSLGSIADLFAPELTILSYQHGIAKPSPGLFEMLADRLAGRGISPEETLFIGNDPLQDILPAAALGFKTALFTGHPDSFRPGDCTPDFVIRKWSDLANLGSSKMHGE